MKKYQFELIRADIQVKIEHNPVVPAHSLADAIRKFSRKHDLESPAYWDEPFFDTAIELIFKTPEAASLTYRISW